MNKEFIPVQATSIMQSNKTNKELYPGKAVMILSPVVEGKNKMLTFNKEAMALLGITEEGQRIAITKGYLDAQKTKIGNFLYVTTDKTFEYVDNELREIKLNSAEVKLKTKKAPSAQIHSILSANHTRTQECKEEKVYVIYRQYGDKYWLLKELEEVENQTQIVLESSTNTVKDSTLTGENTTISVDRSQPEVSE